MKTRIRTVEYNDGRKEYACQYRDINTANSFAVIFTFVVCMTILYGLPYREHPVLSAFGVWFTLMGAVYGVLQVSWEYFLCNEKMETHESKVSDNYAIFSNITSAEDFINKKLKEESNNKKKEWNDKIKSTTNIKFP